MTISSNLQQPGIQFTDELAPEEIEGANPLFMGEPTQPEALPPEKEGEEPIQLAGLGSALSRGLGRQAEKQAIPAIKVSEEAADLTETFIEKHQMDIEMPDKAVNINLQYMDAPEKVNQVIVDMADMMPQQVQKARRNVQGWDQTKLLANELGLTEDELLKRPIGEAWNAEKITAARWVLADTRDKVAALAEKVSAKQATDEEKAEFRALMSKYAGIQMQLHGIAAEAGRALNAFKIVSQSGELRKSEIETLITRSGGDIERLAKGFTGLSDPAKQAKFARDMSRPGAYRMFLEYWINALLSSPTTHAVNVTSNAVVSLAQIPETLMASGFGRIFSDGKGVQAGEGMARMYGLYAGMKDGFFAAARAFKAGEPSDASMKMEVPDHTAITGKNVETAMKRGVESLNHVIPGKGIDPNVANLSDPVQAAVDHLGTFMRIPSRFLLTEDEFFKAINYRMELNAQAYRAAKAEGLEGQELAQFVTRFIETPPENVNVAAIESAKYHTFTNELGEPGQKFAGALNSYPISRLIVPFFRTPVNILKFSAERMIPPIPGIPSRLKDDLLSGDPVRRDMAMGRMSMGAMVWATVVPLVAEYGECENRDMCIIGALPSDPKLAATYKRMGYKEYSIKVGNKFYSYNRSDPFGQMIGIAADASRIMPMLNDEDATEFATGMVMAVSNNVVNKTYMSGIADAMEVFRSNDQEKWAKYGRQLAASTEGSFIGAVERTIDPEWRKATDVWEKFKAKTPGLSTELPPYRDLWGRALRNSVWGDEITQYMAMISPIQTGTLKVEPVDRELARLGYAPGSVRKVMDGVELEPKEHDYLVRMAGNELKAPAGTVIPVYNPGTGETDDIDISGKGSMNALNAIVRSPVYKTLTDSVDPPGQKVRLIRSVVEQYRDLAKLATLKKYDRLLEAIIESKSEDLRAVGAPEDEVLDAGSTMRMEYRDTFDTLEDIDLTGD
jgi:hypothetical protein